MNQLHVVGVISDAHGLFLEAANAVALHYQRCAARHVSQLCHRLRTPKGHAKAIKAVARHLAEAVFWVLYRQTPYRDPALGRSLSKGRG
ncbi:MAG: hypothetical protein ABSD58_04405 [Verrucomicrobiia bacterium]|jgi:hypothetical protein